MPRTTTWKLLLIAGIAAFAAAATSIARAEMARTTTQTDDTAVAPCAVAPICPSVQGQTSRPIGATSQRVLAQAPISRVAGR